MIWQYILSPRQESVIVTITLQSNFRDKNTGLVRLVEYSIDNLVTDENPGGDTA